MSNVYLYGDTAVASTRLHTHLHTTHGGASYASPPIRSGIACRENCGASSAWLGLRLG